MKKDQYRIRAHHGMCLVFFEGKGYSSEFAEHMGKVKRMLEADPPIRITTGADVICGPCPNNKGGICETAGKVLEYDRQVLLRCGIPEGTVMPFLDFDKLVRDRILLPGRREEICGDCRWSKLCHLKNHKQETCEDMSREK